MTPQTHDFKQHTLATLLPNSKLAEKWVALLTTLRGESSAEERDRQFLFAHGWLRALVDAELLSNANLSELRELLIAARPK